MGNFTKNIALENPSIVKGDGQRSLNSHRHAHQGPEKENRKSHYHHEHDASQCSVHEEFTWSKLP
jgi:hypothetical protein